MNDHIHQSNLIESIDDPEEDRRSLIAWNYLSAQPEVGIFELLETHRIITGNQLSKRHAGHFRTEPVWIGGKIAPSWSVAQAMIENLLLDLKEYPDKYTPLEAHVLFEHAHPFIDGNGRTGRMLMWWHEQKLGLEPTLITYADRQKYYGNF